MRVISRRTEPLISRTVKSASEGQRSSLLSQHAPTLLPLRYNVVTISDRIVENRRHFQQKQPQYVANFRTSNLSGVTDEIRLTER